MLRSLNPHARNTVYYGLSMFLPRAIVFVLLPVFTRWLTPADFGEYTLLNACLNALRLVLVLGFAQSVIWSLTFQKTDERATLSSALTIVVGAGLVLCSLMILAAPWICSHIAGGTIRVDLFRLVALTAAVECLEFLAGAYFRSRGQAGRFAFSVTCRFLLEAGLKIFFLVSLQRGVEGLVLAGLITSCVMSVFSLWMVRKVFAPVFSWPIARGMLRYGLPLVPVQLALMSQDVADRYVLNHYATPYVVGIYSLGYNVGMTITFIVQTLQLGWFPLMFKLAARENAGEIFGRLTTAYCAILTFAGLGLAAFGSDLIRVMATPDYHAAVYIVPAIVLAYMVQGVAYFTNVGITTRNRNYLSAVIAIGGAALNLALNFLLIPRLGMVGAVWATLISAVALSAAYISVNQWLFPIRYDLSRIARIAAAGLLLFLGAHMADSWTLIPRLATKALLVASFPLLLFLTGTITRADLAKLRSLIAKKDSGPKIQPLENSAP